jgi:hypothetical protein
MKVQICRLWCAALVLAALLGTATLLAHDSHRECKSLSMGHYHFQYSRRPVPGEQAVAMADNVIGSIASMTSTHAWGSMGR